jgi:hypothetical protein
VRDGSKKYSDNNTMTGKWYYLIVIKEIILDRLQKVEYYYTRNVSLEYPELLKISTCFSVTVSWKIMLNPLIIQ